MTPASLVLDLVERVWNGGDLDALDNYYAASFEHDGRPSTVDELRAWLRDDRATWAGTAFSVLECVGSDDAVALLWRATSTHVGPWGRFRRPVARSSGSARTSSASSATASSPSAPLSDRFGKAIQLGAHLAPPEPPRTTKEPVETGSS